MNEIKKNNYLINKKINKYKKLATILLSIYLILYKERRRKMKRFLISCFTALIAFALMAQTTPQTQNKEGQEKPKTEQSQQKKSQTKSNTKKQTKTKQTKKESEQKKEGNKTQQTK